MKVGFWTKLKLCLHLMMGHGIIFGLDIKGSSPVIDTEYVKPLINGKTLYIVGCCISSTTVGAVYDEVKLKIKE